MKTAGREAGKFCIVVGKEDEDFVTVTGPRAVTKVRRRRCNVHHLEPTALVLKIKEGATDREIISAFEKQGVYGKLKLEKPTEEEIRLAEKARERKKVAKAGKPAKKEEKPAKKEGKKPGPPARKKEKKEKKAVKKAAKKAKKAPKKAPKKAEKTSKPKKRAAKKPAKTAKKKAKKKGKK